MRAADADRDGVLAALSEHFQAGRLTSAELDERIGRALSARTLDELDALTADLPGPLRAGPGQVAQTRRRRELVFVPLMAALAAVCMVSVVLGATSGHHKWDIWWIVPVALLIARRASRPGRR